MNLDPGIRQAEQEHNDALKEAEAKMDTDEHEAPRQDEPQLVPAEGSIPEAGQADAGPERFEVSTGTIDP